MKIFDTRWKGAHGIGRFASELHTRLEHFEPITLPGHPWGPLEPLNLARYLRRRGPELFFSPGYNAPLGTPCPFVFCIHDLNHLFVKENSSALKRAYYASVIRPATQRARAVLTVSEFSRRAICDWARIDPARVIDVGNGVSKAFRSDGPRYAADARPYFLQIGCHKPHKNFERVLQAFAASGLARDFMLICTGEPPAKVRDLVTQLRLQEHVKFVGTVSEDTLAALYRGSTALVFVSYYEGFGIPIVEAMACGAPVLTANVTSMPEIAGDAALLVNPYDIDAIRESLVKLAQDSGLRESLRARGIERARIYSWDATAEKVKAVLSRWPAH